MIRLRYASDGHVDQLNTLTPARPYLREHDGTAHVPRGDDEQRGYHGNSDFIIVMVI